MKRVVNLLVVDESGSMSIIEHQALVGINETLTTIQKMQKTHQNLERVFPELSSSEREICYLILQNKKLSEIGILLNKTESNITTQRGNIRKKLGMNPSDNLQKVLEKRIRE